MGFLNYLLLGTIAYGLGWGIRIYVLEKQKPAEPYHLTHPTIIKYLLAFFCVMLVVSWAIGRFILGQQGLDIAFILVNSFVATFVFSFGLNPEQSGYDVPD